MIPSRGVLGGLTIGAHLVGAATIASGLGVVVLAAGITLVLVDGFLLWMESSQSRLQEFFNEVLAAKEREFRRPVGYRAGDDPSEGAACRTRRLFATLNHHLSTRSPV